MPTTKSLLETYGAISLLAKVLRHNSTTFDSARRENVAEHSYSLVVLGCALASELNKTRSKPLDVGKIAQLASVHDFPEAFMDEGDISVYASKKLLNAKKKSGEAALKKLGSATHGYPWIAKMAEEYERRVAPEARFVHALDKLVVHMNVILSGQHHAKPTFEKYLETEKIARGKIAASFPDLLPCFEDLCRMFHERPEFFKQ